MFKYVVSQFGGLLECVVNAFQLYIISSNLILSYSFPFWGTNYIMFDYLTEISIFFSSFYFFSSLLILPPAVDKHPVSLSFNYCIFQFHNFHSIGIFYLGPISKIHHNQHNEYTHHSPRRLFMNCVIYTPAIPFLPHSPSQTTTDLLSVPIVSIYM